MHVSICKFLLICMDLVHFGAHMNKCVASSYLTSENMTSLSSCSWLLLAINGTWSCESPSLSTIRAYVHVIHNEFFSVSSIDCSDSAALTSYWASSSLYNLALGCDRWNLIIILIRHVLLYRMKHWQIVLLIVWILNVVHHEICASSCSQLDFTTYLIVSSWRSSHCSTDLPTSTLGVVFSPILMVHWCILSHRHVHIMATFKIYSLHIKSHGNVVLGPYVLVGTVSSFLVLWIELLGYVYTLILHSSDWSTVHSLILS